MNLPVVLRPEAEADLRSARDWYDQQRAGLGDELAKVVDELLANAKVMPEMYGLAHKNVRRGHVRKFPYAVYYRVLPDQIEVVAILHGRRDPKTLQSRA